MIMPAVPAAIYLKNLKLLKEEFTNEVLQNR